MKFLKHYTALIISGIFIFVSCNNNDVQNREDEVSVQQEVKKKEPADILQQAKNLYLAHDYDAAIISLYDIIYNNSQSPEFIEASALLVQVQKAQKEALENNAWKSAFTGNDISAIENYLSQYPKTVHSKEAAKKIKQLKIESEQNAYDNAMNQESSSLWKQFLKDYPGRNDIADIKRKIIKAEIAEIKNAEGTLDLPASSATGMSSGSSSSILINNNTEYTLTVRYSGPTVTSVDIPSHGARSVRLGNGDYDVAATAGSTSCAGHENMDGSYEVTYYITTRRY